VSDRDPFATYKERLAALGFRPRRQLGQNFLLQPELHRVIAATGQVGGDDVVLEIGAGLGFLTRELASRAHRVLAVEIDARLCEVLRQELPRIAGGDRVRLLHTDILGDGGRISPLVAHAIAEECAHHPLKVVANLPYAITGPVLVALCTSALLPTTMALLMQREAADRLTAARGEPTWGSLSVMVQACYQVRIARQVGREVFRPRPNVDSAIVALDLRSEGLGSLPAHDRTGFAAFVRALFAGRRKKLKHRLAAAAAAAGLAPPDPKAAWPVLEARPAHLEVADLVNLWQRLRGGS
jgi:16S rRNA (adenine1518-N6/adenine1519-N6)-dimethyltransferase